MPRADGDTRSKTIETVATNYGHSANGRSTDTSILEIVICRTNSSCPRYSRRALAHRAPNMQPKRRQYPRSVPIRDQRRFSYRIEMKSGFELPYRDSLHTIFPFPSTVIH